MKTKVLLVDDHVVMSEGLRLLLEQEPGIQVVALAQDGQIAMKLAQDLQPDVVIMDINMPNMDGIYATHQLHDQFKQMKVIALSVHTDNELVANMIQAGASGYLPKSCAPEELIRAIQTVMRNEVYLSPKVHRSVFEYLQDLPSAQPLSSSFLTPREREVLKLIAEGKVTKEISSHLHISENTVDSHRKNIMDKLGVRTVAEMTKYAIRHGLTSLEN